MNDRETLECAQAMWNIKQFLMNVRIFRQKAACGVKGVFRGLCNVNHNVHCNEAEIDGCQTNLGCQPLDVIVITLHTLLLRFTVKT